MKAIEYFGRMTLNELIEWYNNNMIDFSCNVGGRVMRYNRENLEDMAEEIGLEEFADAEFQGVLRKKFDTCSDFFYINDGVLCSFNTREEFEKAFLPQMIDEFENQELCYEDYE